MPNKPDAERALAEAAMAEALKQAGASDHVKVEVVGMWRHYGHAEGPPWRVALEWRKTSGKYGKRVKRKFNSRKDGTYNVAGIAAALKLGHEEGAAVAKRWADAEAGRDAAEEMLEAACAQAGIEYLDVCMGKLDYHATREDDGTVVVTVFVQPAEPPGWSVEMAEVRRTCTTVADLADALQEAAVMAKGGEPTDG